MQRHPGIDVLHSGIYSRNIRNKIFPAREGRAGLYHNSTPVSTAVWGKRRELLAGRARLDGRPPQVRASGSPELRGCLRRNAPDHLANGSSETRIARMSQAKWPGPPRERRLRAQFCEDVSGETLNPGQLRNESCEDVSSETAKIITFC